MHRNERPQHPNPLHPTYYCCWFALLCTLLATLAAVCAWGGMGRPASTSSRTFCSRRTLRAASSRSRSAFCRAACSAASAQLPAPPRPDSPVRDGAVAAGAAVGSAPPGTG